MEGRVLSQETRSSSTSDWSSSLWISLLGVDFSSQRQALGWEGSEIKKKKKRKKKRKKKEAKQKCYSSFSPKESTDF